MENIKIHRIPLGAYQCNCYLIENILTGNALIIDCGDGLGFQKYIDENNIKVNIKYGLLTHGHFDHVMGVEYIQKNYGTIFFMGVEDLKAQYEEPYLFPKLKDINVVYDGLDMNFEDFKVRTIATPGHTKGSISYLFENNVFTGDTLFKGNIGRTDLYGGDSIEILNSIKNKLYTLPENTVVYSGHGEETTIGEEIRNNEFVI